MTVQEFVQALLFIAILLMSGIVMPVGIVVSGTPATGSAIQGGSGPVFVFQDRQ